MQNKIHAVHVPLTGFATNYTGRPKACLCSKPAYYSCIRWARSEKWIAFIFQVNDQTFIFKDNILLCVPNEQQYVIEQRVCNYMLMFSRQRIVLSDSSDKCLIALKNTLSCNSVLTANRLKLCASGREINICHCCLWMTIQLFYSNSNGGEPLAWHYFRRQISSSSFQLTIQLLNLKHLPRIFHF